MSISSVSVMSLNMLHVSMLKWNRTTSSPLDYPSGVLFDLIWGYKAKPDSFFLLSYITMLTCFIWVMFTFWSAWVQATVRGRAADRHVLDFPHLCQRNLQAKLTTQIMILILSLFHPSSFFPLCKWTFQPQILKHKMFIWTHYDSTCAMHHFICISIHLGGVYVVVSYLD